MPTSVSTPSHTGGPRLALLGWTGRLGVCVRQGERSRSLDAWSALVFLAQGSLKLELCSFFTARRVARDLTPPASLLCEALSLQDMKLGQQTR